MVVNKRRPLQPIGYVPTDLIYPNLVNNNNQPLRQEAAEQLLDMLQAAKDAGAGQGVIASGYRSFDLQDRIYTKLSSQLGDAEADETTARPGYSEHQTGLAVDIDDNGGCNLSLCFERTDLGRWLRENSWKWGFILRYPADKTDVTGYSYEPWHFRYVQKEVAQQMHEQGITTLEEFFNLPAATSYSE